ncbi:MAG: CocE/NonD family hydrolase [Actinobacteria bacterium]|nr:CocE/NonD family hydrolase [Actinomycetota bacterium]
MTKYIRVVLALSVFASVFAPSAATARSARDRGKAWEPKPVSKALYGTKSPDEDPDRQRHYVQGHDGTDLYVETWLPAPKSGKTPPKRIPTILIMTPYVVQGQEEYPEAHNPYLPGFIDYYTARGYAVAQHHVRGTGESGGCLEQTAQNQVKDGANVVEYLGTKAPWTNGRVGMYGASYDAETQISTAGQGDPDKIKYLKAIIPTASVGSQYDWNFMDGVPWSGQPAIGNTFYLAGVSLFPGNEPAPQHYPEKLECQDEVMLSSADQSGDFTDYWREREYRPGAPNVKAATLMVHGLRDFNVQPITLAGWFDHLPKTTPHKGLFGVWNHAFPARHNSVEPEWARDDWYDMVTAWFDRYLKRKDTGVEKWPAVQVQASNSQWWAVKEFPTTGGPPGQLSLGPNGKLGRRRIKGSTVFREQVHIGAPGPGEAAVFQTPKVRQRLHVTGQPVLDLWLKSSDEDAHVAVELEVIGRDGEPMRHEGSRNEAVATYGVRSIQHRKPMRRGWFNQRQGEPIPPGEALKVPIRFLPTDLFVPKGGRLRLTVSGSVEYSKGESMPSGSASEITILHSCNRPSVLRFLLPNRKSKLLNVRERDEHGRKLKSNPGRIGKQTGGGLATRKVCGKAPKRIAFLRPTGVARR